MAYHLPPAARAALALLVLLGAACGDDPLSPSDRYGIYGLIARNGAPAPVAVNFPNPRGDGTVTAILGASFRLGDDMPHQLTVWVEFNGGGPISTIAFGDFHEPQFSGERVTLTLDNGSSVTGTFGGSRDVPSVTLQMGEPWGTLLLERMRLEENSAGDRE